jgi:hypothetical protein
MRPTLSRRHFLQSLASLLVLALESGRVYQGLHQGLGAFEVALSPSHQTSEH